MYSIMTYLSKILVNYESFFSHHAWWIHSKICA